MTSSPTGSRQVSSRGRSVPGSAAQGRFGVFDEDADEPYRPNSKEIVSGYSDPLGPMPERPKTAAGNKGGINENEFADEEIGDDLLPE